MIAELTAKLADLKEFSNEQGTVAARQSKVWLDEASEIARAEGAKVARLSLAWMEERNEDLKKEVERHANFTQKVFDGAVKVGANAHKTAAQVQLLRKNVHAAEAILSEAKKATDFDRVTVVTQAVTRLDALASETEKLALLKVEALAHEDYGAVSGYHMAFNEKCAMSAELLAKIQSSDPVPLAEVSSAPPPPGPPPEPSTSPAPLERRLSLSDDIKDAITKREERLSLAQVDSDVVLVEKDMA